VVILTALPVEYTAVRAHLTEVERREHPSGTVFDCGRLADTGFTAALALIGEGNETAALITEQAYNLFAPRALLFVGVAGGLSEELDIGDVVVGTRIYAYHGAKLVPGASLARPRAWEASWRLLQAALHAAFDPDVTVRFKPIAAGEVVLNDRTSDLSTQLRQHYNDAAAIEMESAGVSRAAHLSGRLDALTIRGISDKADGHKHAADARGMQQLAAARAASVAVAVLRELGRSVTAAPPPGPLAVTPVPLPEADPGPWLAPDTKAPGATGPGRSVPAPGDAGTPQAEDPPAPAHAVPDTGRAASSAAPAPAAAHGTGAPGPGGQAPGSGAPADPGPAVSPQGARVSHRDARAAADEPARQAVPPWSPEARGAGSTRPAGSGAIPPSAGAAPSPGHATAGPAAPAAHQGAERTRDAAGPETALPPPHGSAARHGTQPPLPARPRTADGDADHRPAHDPGSAPAGDGGTGPARTHGTAPPSSGDTADATVFGTADTPGPGAQEPAATGAQGTTGPRAQATAGTTAEAGARLARRLPGPLRPLARHPVVSLASLALALVLVLVLPFVWPGDGGTDDAANTGEAASALPSCPVGEADTTLRIAASVDLSKALGEAAAEYGARRAAGHCVKIAVDGVNSGTAMRALAAGWGEDDGPEPDVWSPAGSEWLALARTKATPEALRRLPETAEPIVTSPLTIAMPKPMAEALGWPEQRIGWTDLAQWAEDPQDFWAKRGQQQWGALKLGKTNPEYSTSGLNATIGVFYARTGTSGELSAKDVDAAANQALVRTIEKSVVHYGDTTLTFLANLRAADDAGGRDEALRYISAVTVEEDAVVAYNLGYPCGAYSDDPGCARTGRPATPLVSLYPKDSNPVSDHPYVALNALPAQKSQVSGDFLDHLHDEGVYRKFFAPHGFRTHEGKAGPQITQANGALPDTGISAYNAPKGPVLDRIQQAWVKLRRPANVLVVIDTSTSMDDKVPGTGKTKMELLKAAEPALFGQFGAHDRVGLWKFSNAANMDGRHHYQQLVPIGPLDEKPPGSDTTRRKQLTREVQGLVPNGSTGLYGTVDAAVGSLRGSYDPDAINAIVLLTDGRNEGVPTRPTLQEVLARIGKGNERVRVFTIAYGSEADQQDAGGRTVLQEIAAATGGRAYDARNPKVIREVLTSVISNF
jgi:nucleoside phosphorylase